MKTQISRTLALTAMLAVGSLAAANPVQAHCDGLDGPVVAAGQRALESGDVGHALVWVLPADEAEIRQAFEHSVQVRTLGAEARDLADRHFFETLVRVHRAGEGEPYTGLKPADRDLGPVIPAADRALENGSVEELETLVVEAFRQELRERFAAARAAAAYEPTDVSAGRAFVSAYVPFLHYVEGVHEAVQSVHGHSAPDSVAHDDPHGSVTAPAVDSH